MMCESEESLRLGLSHVSSWRSNWTSRSPLSAYIIHCVTTDKHYSLSSTSSTALITWSILDAPLTLTKLLRRYTGIKLPRPKIAASLHVYNVGLRTATHKPNETILSYLELLVFDSLYRTTRRVIYGIIS